MSPAESPDGRDGIPSGPTRREMIGKGRKAGLAPSVLLVDPKYEHNVAAAVRAASCFGLQQVWFTGDRVRLDSGRRLPREERMRGLSSVDLIQHDYPFDCFPEGVTPVAIEVRPNSEPLPEFEHPENPVYVFGPEDGGLARVTLQHCHRFVSIPVRHCMNLSAAVYVVLYDRMLKRRWAGIEDAAPLAQTIAEPRPWKQGGGR